MSWRKGYKHKHDWSAWEDPEMFGATEGVTASTLVLVQRRRCILPKCKMIEVRRVFP